MKLALVVQKQNCQPIRKALEEHQLSDLSYRLKDLGNGTIAIPLKHNAEDQISVAVSDILSKNEINVEYDLQKLYFENPSLSSKCQVQTPYENLVIAVTELLNSNGMLITEILKQDIPAHWEKHGKMVLLPENSFKDGCWKTIEPELWTVVRKCLDATGIARKDVISKDGFRTPQVTLLHGKTSWVDCTENGIRYTYDITKCMFSAGNITEKMRIAKFDCSYETVVDLYAGIGYFTLPYLVHAKALYVHACEWNPNAVDALKKNLILNNVADRCTVYQGDNRQMCPKNFADRVNLGLIPSSEEGWTVACAALKKTGGYLHIHSNVEIKSKTTVNQLVKNENRTETDASSHTCNKNHKTEKSSFTKMEQWTKWAEGVSDKIKHILECVHIETKWTTEIRHIEHVKSYAPHIDHMVLDLECRPES